MKRIGSALVAVALVAVGLVTAAALAGRQPAALQQQTGTTTTATTATTSTTITTLTTTTTVTNPGGQTKVLVCHHTRGKGGTHHRTLRVSPSGARTHLTKHPGDTPGACTSPQNVQRHSATAHVKRFHRGKSLRAELKANAGGKGKGKGRGRRP